MSTEIQRRAARRHSRGDIDGFCRCLVKIATRHVQEMQAKEIAEARRQPADTVAGKGERFE